MGTSLTGLEIRDTYDALLKITDNGPLSGSLKTLTDGLGNDSALALSTGAIQVTGINSTSANNVNTGYTADLYAMSIRQRGASAGISGTNFTAQLISAAGAEGLEIYTPNAKQLVLGTNATERLRITSTGNVLLGSQKVLGINTADGSDNGYLAIAGASEDGTARGGHIYLSGNERLTDAGSVVIAGGTTSTGTGATASIVFRTNGSEVGRFLAGGGLTFNGDTAAANALDDYEEGTFTPTVVGTSTAGTATYTEQVGRYTKIGRLVQFEIYLVYSAGTGTGDLRVSGLPFTIGGTSYPPITIGAFDNITMTADNIPMAWGFSGTTTIVIQQMPTGGGVQAGIAYDGAGSMQLTGTYSV